MHTQQNVLRIDSALRLRYDWSHKYAPNCIRVAAWLKRKKKKIFFNEVARLTPWRVNTRYLSRFASLSFVKLVALSRIIVFRPQDRDEDAAAAPSRQMQDVVVLCCYFYTPGGLLSSIFIVVLEFTIRIGACLRDCLSPVALENQICWRRTLDFVRKIMQYVFLD